MHVTLTKSQYFLDIWLWEYLLEQFSYSKFPVGEPKTENALNFIMVSDLQGVTEGNLANLPRLPASLQSNQRPAEEEVRFSETRAGRARLQDVSKLAACPSGFPWFPLWFPPFAFTIATRWQHSEVTQRGHPADDSQTDERIIPHTHTHTHTVHWS